MVGAQYHDARKCTQQHFIRPALYAFYEHGLPEQKAFVERNLGICVWDKGFDQYINWLVVPPGDNIPNHLKLYWWMLMFWKQVAPIGVPGSL